MLGVALRHPESLICAPTDLWGNEELQRREQALNRFDRIDRTEPAMTAASGL